MPDTQNNKATSQSNSRRGQEEKRREEKEKEKERERERMKSGRNKPNRACRCVPNSILRFLSSIQRTITTQQSSQKRRREWKREMRREKEANRDQTNEGRKKRANSSRVVPFFLMFLLVDLVEQRWLTCFNSQSEDKKPQSPRRRRKVTFFHHFTNPIHTGEVKDLSLHKNVHAEQEGECEPSPLAGWTATDAAHTHSTHLEFHPFVTAPSSLVAITQKENKSSDGIVETEGECSIDWIKDHSHSILVDCIVGLGCTSRTVPSCSSVSLIADSYRPDAKTAMTQFSSCVGMNVVRSLLILKQRSKEMFEMKIALVDDDLGANQAKGSPLPPSILDLVSRFSLWTLITRLPPTSLVASQTSLPPTQTSSPKKRRVRDTKD
ncbi:hypothetical protein BLNAU_12314 [Blattamonas nauphoetae]|uniref:Uncharacterized protein n=1 Tax=Blattamonas nauphoetae TaxID=2049346 RepID=A0ABQ9XN81_9EUKA|nr:hypothetical protein BLNAU_12314 [Blattamonas nauphoetae]